MPGEKQVTTSPFPWTGPRAVTSTSPFPSGPARCPPVPVQPAPPSPVRTGHALPQPAELWPFYHCSRRLLASSPHHLSARILRRIRRSLPGGPSEPCTDFRLTTSQLLPTPPAARAKLGCHLYHSSFTPTAGIRLGSGVTIHHPGSCPSSRSGVTRASSHSAPQLLAPRAARSTSPILLRWVRFYPPLPPRWLGPRAAPHGITATL